ncbi:hypothetical protein [Streptomyces sp. NPDC042319]|uniref:hypothetical protein n=1 Tax=Streptomyces sp. NPDC042319 TaxID=3154332 RepID=UPI00340A83A0
MVIRGIGKWWLVAALTASAVLTSGCTYLVDTDELPGMYRNDATGGEILLERDGTFSANDVSTNSSSGPADFSGRWEFVDSSTTSDFIYLDVDGRGIGEISGIQLYTSGRGTVEFSTPDEPWSLVLTKVSAQ